VLSAYGSLQLAVSEHAAFCRAALVTRLTWRIGASVRLLYQFGPCFERITLGALWADTRLGLGYLRLLDGCAVVSDIGRRRMADLAHPVRVVARRPLHRCRPWPYHGPREPWQWA
jgi:hypothetical protein